MRALYQSACFVRVLAENQPQGAHMSLLYQLPVPHTIGDQTAGMSPQQVKEVTSDKAYHNLKLINPYLGQYWQYFTASFMQHLYETGLINRKKRFTRPVHVFMDALDRPGHELLRIIREHELHLQSPAYGLLTRLCAAGGVLEETELKTKLRLGPKSDEELDRITRERDDYIEQRIASVLSGAEPDAVAILIIGGAHRRMRLPAPHEVKIYHRMDLLPLRMLKVFFDETLSTPMCMPDDFGHKAGHDLPSIPG
jgi:hypothetical protein